MRLADFDYELPADRIAQTPADPRDSARLLVDRGSEPAAHHHVRDLASFLRAGDLLVVNDTRVIPARLHLRRQSGGSVEVLLLESEGDDDSLWTALVRPGGKLKPGEDLHHERLGHVATFVGRHSDGDTFVVRLRHDGNVVDLLDRIGEMPLPPYITERLAERERYQTVYSRRPASAAAPTAGLHLTDTLLDGLDALGVGLAKVELVVGLDTFQPVQVDNPLEHRMHTEFYDVPADTLDRVREARRVVAVGTTAVRAVESALTRGERSGRTNLFIHRGYEWKAVDALLTNFHLPRTTLLMMIDAFVGSRWRRLYAEALENRYRFLSFGDAMLLDRHLI